MWRALHHLTLEKLGDKTFRKLPRVQALALMREHRLACGLFRFLPKTASMRHICNMGWRPDPAVLETASLPVHGGRALSVNQQLANLFSILSFEKVLCGKDSIFFFVLLQPKALLKALLAPPFSPPTPDPTCRPLWGIGVWL